jgi:uncharacterized protein (TIGR03382 family)
MKITLTALAALSCAGAAFGNGIDFRAIIDGSQAGVTTPAIGTLSGTFFEATNTFEFSWTITDNLIGNPAAPGAHIHDGDFGESGPIVFAMSNSEWELDGMATWENMSSENVTALLNGGLYANFHTSQFPGGEVRGQIEKVPAPGAAGVFGLGALALMRRRR